MVQRVSRTSRYYPKGIQKVAYVRWYHARLVYYLQSVRLVVPHRTSTLQTEVYVCPLWVSVKLLFLEAPNMIRLKLKVLGFRLSSSTKGSD
jgi:hypothetical protein